MKLKNNRGVTLTALVVTLIVLAILTGITISYITDDNGIIETAKKERNQTEETTEKADQEIDYLYSKLQEVPKIGYKAEENETINGKAYGSYNPVIPKGYYPVNTETSKWVERWKRHTT